MCGIVCAFNLKQPMELLRPKVLQMSKKIRHRGPDWSGIYSNKSAIIAHERLAIVDPSSGQQPLFSQDARYVLAANGEIYNHKELRCEFPEYSFATKSDCEVILPLYEKYGPNFLDKLNGIFAFTIYDSLKDEYFVARGLYPNVDFYSGIIYRAIGIPTDMFTVMFALGRLPGWVAQWKEMRENNEPIGRPRQVYVGHNQRIFSDISNR